MLYLITFIAMILQDSTVTENASVELQGLYEPPPVAFSFETIGWPILGGVILLTLLIIAYLQIRKYRQNKYRRVAIAELNDLVSSSAPFDHVFVILKKVAIQTFGREKIGQLYGKDWLSFLEKSGKKVQWLSYECQIDQILYNGKQPDSDTKYKLLSNAKKWVKTHA